MGIKCMHLGMMENPCGGVHDAFGYYPVIRNVAVSMAAVTLGEQSQASWLTPFPSFCCCAGHAACHRGAARKDMQRPRVGSCKHEYESDEPPTPFE